VLAIVSLKVVGALRTVPHLRQLAAAPRGASPSCSPRVASSAFVVFGAAKALGVIDDLVFVMAVAVISLTMLLTPVLVKIGNRLAQRMDDRSLAVDQQPDYPTGGDESPPRVVIAGYGRVGHTVGTIMSSQRHPLRRFRRRRRTRRQVAQRGSSCLLW
jgi:glutathione-regulated potassium-efflux system ancillary protein KefC